MVRVFCQYYKLICEATLVVEDVMAIHSLRSGKGKQCAQLWSVAWIVVHINWNANEMNVIRM